MVKRPRAGGFALDSPVTPLPRPVGAGYGAPCRRGRARGVPRLSDPRAVLCLADAGGGAPSLGAGSRERPPGSRRPEWVVVRPVGAGLWCAPGSPRAVLRLADEGGGAPSLGAGSRERPPKKQAAGMGRAAPRRRGVVVRPVGVTGAGSPCAGRHGGKARSKTGAPRGAKGAFGAAFCAGPRPAGGGEREKRKGVCRRRLLRQTPSFSLSRSVLGMLCAGCPTALPWPVRPARRRRTPPARAPARPRPGPWPHTALPFRSF